MSTKGTQQNCTKEFIQDAFNLVTEQGYGFIRQQMKAYPVTVLCRVLRSGNPAPVMVPVES